VSPKPGTLTEQEIWNQPQAWRWVLGEVPGRLQKVKDALTGGEVVFCGCGSALDVALCCAAAFRAHGILARAETSGEIALFDDPVRPWEGRSLVAVSRSGETSETIWALKRAREQGGRTLAITCEAESTLAREAGDLLLLDGCAERSVVTTKSVTGMILAGHVAAQALSGGPQPRTPFESLPQHCQRILETASRTVEQAWREGFSQCAFLGSGLLWGVASEARLKMQEMALMPSESFPVLEFRHGPMAQAGEGMLVVAMISESAREHEVAVLKQLAGFGATIFAVTEEEDSELRSVTPFIVELNSGLPERVRQPLFLPPAQLLALHAARSRGLNPDSPPNLSRAVILQ